MCAPKATFFIVAEEQGCSNALANLLEKPNPDSPSQRPRTPRLGTTPNILHRRRLDR